MAQPKQRRATYEDLLAVPDNLVAEIIDGDLLTSPRPAARHARASSRLGVHLGGPFDSGIGGPGGWIILDEPELHVGGDVVVPDLAGWRRERMPKIPDAAAFELPPDWVCEVLSPGTEPVDRATKMPLYAREHVAYAWLVNPIGRTVEAYRLSDGVWTPAATHGGDVRARIEPFDALELEIGVLWAD
jgi:Uma2 family endonuclease